LARRGHHVTVLTSRSDPSLPAREHTGGVEILRVPVSLKLGKGPIMPLFPYTPRRSSAATTWPTFTCRSSKPSAGAVRTGVRHRGVISYHCDLHLPAGLLNAWRNADCSAHHLAARLAHRIVVTTETTPALEVLRRYGVSCRHSAADPMPAPDAAITQQLRALAIQRTPADRLRRPVRRRQRRRAALARLHACSAGTEARVVFTGAHQKRREGGIGPFSRRCCSNTPTASSLPTCCATTRCRALRALRRAGGDQLNATEAFGMWQVESMLAGTRW